MPTLIVIDMQASFPAACDPNTIIAVTHEIVVAQQQGRPIVLVEYKNCGPSHSGFYKLLQGYAHKSHIHKPADDGSKEILRAIRRRKFDEKQLRVCGVNSDCCVRVTVEGLLTRAPSSKITVIKSACGTEYNSGSWDQYYCNHPNLALV